MPSTIGFEAGKSAFGANAQGYSDSRPDYPGRVFEILKEMCGAHQATTAFEVGAGTGQATGPLLDLGCCVTAIEPDERLADHLAERLIRHRARLRVLCRTFEEASLPDASFDLGIAAMSLHWLDADSALRKAFRLLRPDGYWGMWWTVFGDPDNPDDFQRRTGTLFQALPRSPSAGNKPGTPYALDRDQRTAELSMAGFETICIEEIRWQPTLNTCQIVGLTATFSPVALLHRDERDRFLDMIAEVVEHEFGGSVTRNFVTVLYTAQRPER